MRRRAGERTRGRGQARVALVLRAQNEHCFFMLACVRTHARTLCAGALRPGGTHLTAASSYTSVVCVVCAHSAVSLLPAACMAILYAARCTTLRVLHFVFIERIAQPLKASTTTTARHMLMQQQSSAALLGQSVCETHTHDTHTSLRRDFSTYTLRVRPTLD